MSTLGIELKPLSLDSNHQVAYSYKKFPNSKPPLILLNGLLHSSEGWDMFLQELEKKNQSYLYLNYSTQPESFFGLKTPKFTEGIDSDFLSTEVISAIDSLGIKRFYLMSLSYGSFVGIKIAQDYKDRVLSYTMVTPAIKPTNRYIPFLELQHQTFLAMRYFGGEALYNATIKSYIQAVTKDLSSLETEGVYQMAQAVKYRDLVTEVLKEMPPFHILVAEKEEPCLLKDQKNFWEKMHKNPQRGSFVFLKKGYHPATADHPKEVAKIFFDLIKTKKPKPYIEIEVKNSLSCKSIL